MARLMPTSIVNSIRTQKFAILLALVTAVLYWFFAYELERSDFIRLITLFAGLFILTYQLIKMFGWNFWLLAGMGVVFRLIFLPAIPNLSQDFYRFLWDGRALALGMNPYLFTPEQYLSETGLFSFIPIAQARELYAGMGELNGSHYSNYPPLNQLCFAIAALISGKSILGSAIVLRLLIILADIGILYFGRKLLKALQLPEKQIFWYFLNPFIIIEMTGNLHFEGVMLFFVVWSLYLLHKGKWVWAAVLLGLSVSVKLLPLLFLPLFFRYAFQKEGIFNLQRLSRVVLFYVLTLLTVVITFLPFLSGEFADNFAATIGLWFQKFEFNASIYYIIRWIGFQTIGWNIIASVGKILPLVVIGFLLLLSFFRKNTETKPLITALLFGVSFYFLLSTTVHPWYVATPLILSVFTKYRFAIVWSAFVMLSYSAYGAEGFSENLWLVALEYVVVAGFLLWELFLKKSRQNSLQPIENG
ncbi:glycosyltransferase 87 family protein [Aureisphaera galaxeae]|uniref:glycosyltransferase 87 family protein n=1 Tax=Aureisphaera galaxeae TaxID=1538023 RepID=UPI002350458D|nr:glycosyltransferase 87 family protein [Aureisphaera galaxeae]MDC8002947.1 glycosyltransferase 87 family protein [Aureisphaera galaxeae]